MTTGMGGVGGDPLASSGSQQQQQEQLLASSAYLRRDIEALVVSGGTPLPARTDLRTILGPAASQAGAGAGGGLGVGAGGQGSARVVSRGKPEYKGRSLRPSSRLKATALDRCPLPPPIPWIQCVSCFTPLAVSDFIEATNRKMQCCSVLVLNHTHLLTRRQNERRQSPKATTKFDVGKSDVSAKPNLQSGNPCGLPSLGRER